MVKILAKRGSINWCFKQEKGTTASPQLSLVNKFKHTTSQKVIALKFGTVWNKQTECERLMIYTEHSLCYVATELGSQQGIYIQTTLKI